MFSTAARAYVVQLLHAVVLVLLPQSVGAQSTHELWGDLEPGPYAIGFRSEFIIDRAGSLDGFGDSGRPIRLLIWYPAQSPPSSVRVTLQSYFDIEPSDARFAAYNDALRARDLDVGRRQFRPASDSLFSVVSAIPARARLDATPGNQRFPLVVHSLGRNNFQQENTVLREYLASHGYVVVAVPQAGRTLDDLGVGFTLEDLQLQASDIEATVTHMKGLGYVDTERVALLGHSSGGIAALLVAATRPEIQGIVGLDASFATTDGVALLDQLGPALGGRILNLYAKGKQDFDSSWLDAREGAERFDIGLGSGERPTMATHFDFQMWPLYSTVSGVADPRGEYFRSGDLGAAFYYASCRLTRYFLDYVMNGDTDARDFLTGDRKLPSLAREYLTYAKG